MVDLRRGSALHGGTDDNDFGRRSSKIIFKNCQTRCDRLRPPENVTVTILHVIICNVGPALSCVTLILL